MDEFKEAVNKAGAVVDTRVVFARVFCVYDAKGEHYGKQPFVCANRADAIRGFTKEVNTPGTPLADYPEDFTLLEIGTWDERTGNIDMYGAKFPLGSGLDFKKVS